MGYIKICPKCKSTRIKKVFIKKDMHIVNKCLNCNYLGNELFEDVFVQETKLRK